MKGLKERSGQRRLLLLVVVTLLVVLSWLGQGDRSSAAHLDASLLQASVAFASARALNALISVLQSTTISFSLFGGVAVTLGEMLDPFNDLIEQYAYLMQWAIGSLLAQKILLGLVGQTFFKWLLTLSALLLGASLWLRGGRHAGVFLRLFLVIAFLRFVLVAVVLINGEVDRWYLAQQSREQIGLLDRLPGEVEVLGADTGAEAAMLGGSTAEQALDSQLAMLEEQRSRLIVAQREAGRAVSLQREELTSQEQQLDWSERLNPFAEVPAREDAAKRLAMLRDSYQGISRELSEVEQQRARVLEERSALPAEGDSSWRGLGEQLAKAGDPQTYLAIKQALDEAVDSVLQVMTLFVLRTLILPLLFFYLLLRGWRWLWQLDAERLLGGPGVQPGRVPAA
ncbi:hypothetical protein [Halopseudomonas maritima]|uniref:hypothetical protein n=1 Tax=Halopseudomonas maritima TaxID=2918528 RepID=UPI001EECA22E|nr:hypothetical protein [Halopseudomonas maritima]UJJ31081.1 hypothetical protein HV822_15135 [Halopseudomonas maritima]